MGYNLIREPINKSLGEKLQILLTLRAQKPPKITLYVVLI